MWHASVAARSLPIAAVLEREAERQLLGVGNASLGEWRERGEKAFHLRRRLSEREQRTIGPAVDIRGSDEAKMRASRLGYMLGFAPPEILENEIGRTT